MTSELHYTRVGVAISRNHLLIFGLQKLFNYLFVRSIFPEAKRDPNRMSGGLR